MSSFSGALGSGSGGGGGGGGGRRDMVVIGGGNLEGQVLWVSVASTIL